MLKERKERDLFFILISLYVHFPASSQSSFSSDDSSNDYCAPPENVSPPEPPAHSKEYEEVDSIYSEVCMKLKPKEML